VWTGVAEFAIANAVSSGDTINHELYAALLSSGAPCASPLNVAEPLMVVQVFVHCKSGPTYL